MEFKYKIDDVVNYKIFDKIKTGKIIDCLPNIDETDKLYIIEDENFWIFESSIIS